MADQWVDVVFMTGDADINAAENVLRAGLVQLPAEQSAA